MEIKRVPIIKGQQRYSVWKDGKRLALYYYPDETWLSISQSEKYRIFDGETDITEIIRENASSF